MPPDAALPVPSARPGVTPCSPQGDGPADLLDEELQQIVDQAHTAARSEGTLKAYQRCWAAFHSFCHRRGRLALPATLETILLFLADHGKTRKTGSLRAARAAISYYHAEAGCIALTHQPAVKRFLKGHARLTGAPPLQKAPLYVDDVRHLCAMLDAEGGLAAQRDKGAILLGYAGALRASEAVGARIEHLKINHKGMTLIIPRSKTDQEGKGQYVAIVRTANPSTCPVVAVEEWLSLVKAAGTKDGVLFPALRAFGDPALRQARLETRPLTTAAYRVMLKRRCVAIGLDPMLIGGHSLRSGHATQAAENGADVLEIAQQGRWANLKHLQTYVRSGRRFKYNSSSKLGL